MERHAKVFIVTSFILLSLTGLVVFKLWISPKQASAQAVLHHILFRGPVSGLSVGSEVRYLGVNIGRVTAINISPAQLGHVEVDFNTEQSIPAQQLLAQLEAKGITGLSVIELRLKTTDDPGFVSDGDFIPGYPSLLSQLGGPASNIADSASQVAKKANELLNQENLQSLTNSIKQLDQTTSSLAKASESISGLMSNLNLASIELNETLKTYRQAGTQINQELLPALQNTANELSASASSAKTIISNNAEHIDRLFEQDIPTLMSISDELSQSLKGINELTNGLDNEPTRLLYGKYLPELELTP